MSKELTDLFKKSEISDSQNYYESALRGARLRRSRARMQRQSDRRARRAVRRPPSLHYTIARPNPAC